MRQLRLVFAHTETMTKVLVAATLLPLTGNCGGQADNGTAAQPTANGGSNAATGGSHAGANATGGEGWVIGPETGGANSAGGTAGDSSVCPSYYSSQTYVVALPGGDTPKAAAQLCNWSGTFATDRPAARVALKYNPSSPNQASGTVTLDPDVLNAIDGGYNSLSSIVADGATVSNVVRSNSGCTFDVSFAATPSLGSTYTFKVALSFTCSPIMSSTRTVNAATTVTLCGSYAGDVNWVSSGDNCTICYPMAEMAAQLMPAPAGEPDGIPLPGEVDVRIVEVARQGRTVVLMAHSQRGEGLTLTWHASSGKLVLAAEDVAVWTLPEQRGLHMVQVAAELGPSVSIASHLQRDDA